ncbi:MAG: distal tail protein Dit, partial [Sporomusa sp.]
MNYSVKFNGVELGKYIDILQGFTPFMGVSWVPQLNTGSLSTRGENYSYTRYGSKTIPMPFTITGDISGKYDKLMLALNVSEPKALIFEGVADRVFYAVPSGDLNIDDDECIAAGEITWIVPDGCAHSSVIKLFSAEKNSDGIAEININNSGTESVPITFRIKHKKENGYIGIASEHGAMEFGKIQELDGEDYQASEMLLSGSLDTWPDYTGTKYQDAAKGTSGRLTASTANGKPFLMLSAMGNTGAAWQGAMKQIDLPADSSGHIGAKNWYCWFESWFETGLMGQTGCVNLDFLTADNKIIASYIIEKLDTSGNSAYAHFYVGGNNPRIFKTITFTPSNRQDQNPFDSA